MIISVLVSVLIIMMLVAGFSSPAQLGFFIIIMIGALVVGLVVRNRLADGLTSTFLGTGRPSHSAAELRTDVADGLVQQGEYDAALYAYEQVLRKTHGPRRTSLMLRMAETAMLGQRKDEALRWWKEALSQRKGLTDEQRAGALFRMAEVVQTSQGGARTAAQLLQRVRDEYPGSKYAGYASDRIRDLARDQAPS